MYEDPGCGKSKLPTCENPRCQQTVGEHYWKIGGRILCDECAKLFYRYETEYYEFFGGNK